MSNKNIYSSWKKGDVNYNKYRGKEKQKICKAIEKYKEEKIFSCEELITFHVNWNKNCPYNGTLLGKYI